MTATKLFDFLGRVLMAAVFVNALPAKLTDFAGTSAYIASKGVPAGLASVLLVFLVPTTLIFHTFPVDGGFFMNLALIGGLLLAITRARANAVPSFNNLRAKAHFRHE